MILRAMLLACALGGVLALAGDLRTTRDIQAAVSADPAQRSPGQVNASVAALDEIAGRTPDTTALLRRAQLQIAVEDYAAALDAATEAVRREPRNARAWQIVAFAASGAGDRAADAQARRRVAELVTHP
jgi:Flp pilus assembly protein TadD